MWPLISLIVCVLEKGESGTFATFWLVVAVALVAAVAPVTCGGSIVVVTFFNSFYFSFCLNSAVFSKLPYMYRNFKKNPVLFRIV